MRVLTDIFLAIKIFSPFFTFAVIIMADFILEDKYFTCPCVDKGLRAVYSAAFVLSPAFLFILVDSNFAVLCIACKYCLAKSFFGNRAAFARPCIFAGTWVIYSVMDPRFSDCIVKGPFNRVKQRNCTGEDRLEGEVKSYFAIAILVFSVVTLIFAMVAGYCRGCKSFSSKKFCENVLKREKTEQLTGHTMLILDEEDLLEKYVSKDLEESDFLRLQEKLTIGQQGPLKKECKTVNLQGPQTQANQNARPITI